METDIWANVIALVVLVTGVGMWVYALRFRTPEHPMTMFKVRNWKPVWKMRSWYSPKGYWLNLIGTVLVSVCALMAIIRDLLE